MIYRLFEQPCTHDYQSNLYWWLSNCHLTYMHLVMHDSIILYLNTAMPPHMWQLLDNNSLLHQLSGIKALITGVLYIPQAEHDSHFVFPVFILCFY